MTLKICFEKPSVQKILCLGVYEGKELPLPTENWDKTFNGFLKQSMDHSTFKGRLNQTLTLFVPDGSQFILIGLGAKTDQNELQWQKIGSSLVSALESSPSGEGAVEIHSFGAHDMAKVLSHMALGALLKSWRFQKYFTTKKPEELFSLKKTHTFSP